MNWIRKILCKHKDTTILKGYTPEEAYNIARYGTTQYFTPTHHFRMQGSDIEYCNYCHKRKVVKTK